MYEALIDPPYEFAPRESPPLVVKALQFEHPKLLTCTLTPLAFVAPHVLLLLASKLRLQAYAPTYNTLNDPPYEFAPNEVSEVIEASESIEEVFWTETCTPVACVYPQVLLLLFAYAKFRLQAYAPM
jgi:hypothetical protein